MANFKKTEDYIFSKLCKTYDRFTIPNFQRPYAWKNKQLQEFWDSIVSNEEVYFIGNIVSIMPQTPEESLSIVDGQQRLTTIFLLLASLRTIYRDLQAQTEKDNDKKKIQESIETINYYIYYKEPSHPSEQFVRLTLGKESYQKVFDSIMREEEIDEKKLDKMQKRFLGNTKTLQKYINEYIEESKLSRLEELKDKVLKLQFVVIILESNEDIYGIFEGFNSTGLGLTPSDLIKNAILKATSGNSEIQEETEYLWREMERLFEEKDPSKVTKFLRYFWISENGYILKNLLFREVETKEISDKSPEQVKEYVSELLKEAKVYLGLIYDSYSEEIAVNQELRKALFKFRFLTNDQIYMVLLSIYRRLVQNKVLKQSEWIKTLKNLWIFVVRARYSDISPSKYEREFARMAQYIHEATDKRVLKEQLNNDIKDLFEKVSSEEIFINYFVSDVTYPSDKKIIRQAIEDIMHSENREIIIDNPDIEHILPQSPEKWGLQAKDVDEYVNSIGNLTLLEMFDNRDESKDNPFDLKAKVYKKSAFKINKDIVDLYGAGFRSNPEKVIEKRSIDIAREVNRLWQIVRI